MRITEYERGRQDATRQAIQWLLVRGHSMSDPRARAILHGAADSLFYALQSELQKAKARARARPCKGNQGLADLLTPIRVAERAEKERRTKRPKLVISIDKNGKPTITWKNWPAEWGVRQPRAADPKPQE